MLQEQYGGLRRKLIRDLVCGIERVINKEEDKSVVDKVIPIAGELKDRGGGNLDAKWTLLSTSPSHADSEKEGLLVELNGGFYETGKVKRPQKAIVEFLCDKERTGLENLWNPSEYKFSGIEKMKRDEETPAEDDKNAPSLTLVKYDTSGDTTDILRLKWRTKYACEGAKEELDAEKGNHWGFFTWFIIM